MNRLINFYKQLLVENAKWVKAILIWFGLTVVAGAVTFFFKPDLIQSILNIFQDKFGPNPALSFGFAMSIFQQNLIASSFALFGGLLLGLGPVVVVGINGFMLGFIIAAVVAASGHTFSSLGLLLGGIVPHGIFELTAFFLASSLGLRLGLQYLSHSAKGERWITFKRSFKQVLYFLPVIIILLFVAALVEVFVSGNIVHNF